MIPLPHDNRFSGNNSGSNPYFDGPKNALWVESKKTTIISIVSDLKNKPIVARSIIRTSAYLVPTATLRLLKRVASCPANAENNIKGRAKTNPIKGAHSSAAAFPNTIKITMNLKALSLKAPWNWVRKRLQKPLKDFFEELNINFEELNIKLSNAIINNTPLNENAAVINSDQEQKQNEEGSLGELIINSEDLSDTNNDISNTEEEKILDSIQTMIETLPHEHLCLNLNKFLFYFLN